ncbi:hypothetical protein TNCV_4652061 [Trichonephila clavipes]|nr:hypothetical protein TNCV_4652061 [Trichonephila clavipes]
MDISKMTVMSSRSERQAAPSQSSDAHRSGRPLQRRKPVEDTTVLPSSKCALQKKRLHAISKANVTPVTDMELLRNKAMKDVTLQSSLLAVVTLLWSQTECRNPGTTEGPPCLQKVDVH